MIYMTEEFIPVKGFETKYMISKTGKVYSLWTKKLMHPETDKDGYLRISVVLNGKKKHKSIHQLVAMTFIDNPNNLPQVNHRNGNRQDNRVENLEWCTNHENLLHAFTHNYNGYRDRALTQLDNINFQSKYILIVLINNNTNEVRYLNSVKETVSFLKGCKSNVYQSILQNKPYKNWKIYGYKYKNLKQFANGEPLPDILRGIPWESYLNDNQSCNDYPSEGE